MSKQLTLTQDDASVIEKTKAIVNLNREREWVQGTLDNLTTIENEKDKVLAITIKMSVFTGISPKEFRMPQELINDMLIKMRAYYEDVDRKLIEEAKELMK